MSSKNRRVKNILIERYGEECFIDKLHLRKGNALEKYTSQGQLEKMRQLSYHHIVPRSQGGGTTVENGALLSVGNHRWFHQQPEWKQEKMNKAFQNYKETVDNDLPVVLVDNIHTNYSVKPYSFVPGRGREEYNRAKEKEKTKKFIQKVLDEEEEIEEK